MIKQIICHWSRSGGRSCLVRMILRKIQGTQIPVYLGKKVKSVGTMRKIFWLTAIIFSFGLSSAAWADYVIQLKNGRILAISKFWEEKGVVKFYWQSGIVGIPKKDIVAIKVRKQDSPDKIHYGSEAALKSEQVKIVPVSATTQESAQDQKPPYLGAPKEKASVELHEKQKAYYKAEYEKALERYFEAASRHDAEGKKKAWEEFNRFGGQVISLEEELKKSTPGTTPEQRAQ
jgi:hypothetical protein